MGGGGVWNRGRNRVGVGIRVGVRTSTLILFLYDVSNAARRHTNSNLHHKPNINITNNSHLKTLPTMTGAGMGDLYLPRKPTLHTHLLITSALRPAVILAQNVPYCEV